MRSRFRAGYLPAGKVGHFSCLLAAATRHGRRPFCDAGRRIPLRLRIWGHLVSWRVSFEADNAACRHDGTVPMCLLCCYLCFF
jgi:hypothetical protein